MATPSNGDSWLDSRPPWSVGQSSPLRPTSSTNASMAVDLLQSSGVNSPINLLAQFLRMRVMFELEEITFMIGDHIGTKLGEGATFVVEKRPLPGPTLKPSEREWVAVKRSKTIIPKDPNKAIAMPSESLRRLKAILLEVEVMFHPPLRSHPNIARLIGFSWDHEAPGYTPLLVMELASYGTLAEFLSVEDTNDDERRQLCLDVALGLEVLHNSMIVHGDVKQDNVLVFSHSSRRVIAKLSDFGLALLSDSEQVYRGTPIYNAPEIHLHGLQNNCDDFAVSRQMLADSLFKCDAFSFGLLSFEIFMGGQKYYGISDTEPFRAMLFAGAPDDELYMDEVTELSCNALVPEDLRSDCRSVFRHTLSPFPALRLQNGWDDVKRIFGMRPPENSKDLPIIAQSLRKTTSEKPSMLEFHYHQTFGGDLLESLISELRFLAESSADHKEKAQASFNLCLLSSISIASGVFIEDAALDWLTKAQFYGHEVACQILPRVFGARQDAIPSQVSSETASNAPNYEDEHKYEAKNWYAEAVRMYWGRALRVKLMHDLQHLVFREQITSKSLRERLIECSQNAICPDSVESRFLVHLAVADGDLDILQRLLDLGADINERTPSGETAIQIACIMGNLKMLRCLVERGADAAINDSRNISPIHWLVLFPSGEIGEAAELLVYAKADTKAYPEVTELYFDDLGLVLRAAPLYWAVSCQNHSAISALLRHCEHHGSNISNCLLQEDEKRWSALDAALGTVCADILELLLQHDLLPHKMTVEEKQMCWRKVAYGTSSNKFQRWCIHGDQYETAYIDIIAVFHRYGIEYTNDFDLEVTSWTPLIRASVSCNLFWAKALIKDGAEINYRPMDNTGTALEMAVFSAQFLTDIYAVIKFVKLFLESGASAEPAPLHPKGDDTMLYRSSHYRIGVLHLAVRHGADIPLVQYLLQKVPEQVNRKYEGEPLLNKVPLVYKETDACRVAELLLSAGADSSAETSHQEGHIWTCCDTAASVAIRFDEWRLLKVLLDHDATLNCGVSGNHERSILHHALRTSLQYEHTNLGSNAQRRRERLETFDLLLSHPTSVRNDLVNKPTSEGISPLMHAAIWGLPTHVTTLLQHGADPSYQWKDNSVFTLIEKSRNGEIELPFVVDDEVFDESEVVRTLEGSCSPAKRSEYLSRLADIESSLRRWVVSRAEHDSVVARNTSLPLRLLPSTL